VRLYKKLDLDEIAKKTKHYIGTFKEKALLVAKRSREMSVQLKTKIGKMPKAFSVLIAAMVAVITIGSFVYYSGIINTTVQEETPSALPSVIPENPDVFSSPSYPGDRQDESRINFEIDTSLYRDILVNDLADDIRNEINLVVPAQGSIIREFGFNYSRTFRDYRFHDGVDIEVTQGAPIVAVADGEVLEVLYSEIAGYSITIEHQLHLQTHYRHLTEIFVVRGDNVVQGQEIGRVTEADIYLHFGITYRGNSEDPQKHVAMNN